MKKLVVGLIALSLGACAGPSSMYEWGGYSGSLLQYYKNPGETENFAVALKAALDKAEDADRVPPGLYAEYGYALLELDRSAEAVAYFEKEQAKWPEARPLMSKLISRVSTAGSTSSHQSSAASSNLGAHESTQNGVQ